MALTGLTGRDFTGGISDFLARISDHPITSLSPLSSKIITFSGDCSGGAKLHNGAKSIMKYESQNV